MDHRTSAPGLAVSGRQVQTHGDFDARSTDEGKRSCFGYGRASRVQLDVSEQLWRWADIQSLIRPVGPAPPDMPTGTPPQRSAGPPAVVLPPRQCEATGLHGLATARTGQGVVAHTAHPSGATALSRSNLGRCQPLGSCASHLR